MNRLKSLIRKADDEYLTGISNKGTVKRAYKDMEQESFSLTWKEEEAEVVLKKETCTLRIPLDESRCSCPSRSICRHIVTTILWLKRELSGEEDEPQPEEILKEEVTEEVPKKAQPVETPLPIPDKQPKPARTWEEEQVKQTCRSIRETLNHQLSTGLSRQSPEISESLERLAVIAHRAGLPSLESGLRETSACYQQYFSRSAAFHNEELLGRILILYQKAKKLEEAQDQEEIRTLAGTFRDTYEPVGCLHLAGMGGRTFSSKTGYEGEIYYFLETEQKQWYTWTDARPVFYEGTRRRPPSVSGNALAPWGLNCSREQMQELEFDLTEARAATGGRLSVSKDTTGEITGKRSLTVPAIRSLIRWDYEELLQDYYKNTDEEIGTNKASGRKERLVLAGAVRYGTASFDTVQQRFSWNLYDRAGRQLFLVVKYTKEEQTTIQLLERLEQRLRNRPQKAIVCFGSLYIDEEDRLCLYPIEIFLKEAELVAEDAKTEVYGNPDTALNVQAEQRLPSVNILDTMEQYRREAAGQLSDLFFSGLDSLQEETLTRLSTLSQDGEALGLYQAGESFAYIFKLLQQKRHQMEFSPETVMEMLGTLNACLTFYQKKIAYDKALLTMCRTRADQKF